jgi:uncharacterized protein (TIGR03437 family)
LPVTVTIGGQQAQVSYQGEAPGLAAGVVMVTATVPSGLTPGSVPLTAQINGVASQSGVTIAVSN